MNKITHQIQFGFWHYFALFIVGVLLLAALLRALTPPTATIDLENKVMVVNYDQSSSTFKKIDFIGQEPILPEELSIFRQTQHGYNAQSLAQQIIYNYGLTVDETNPNYWTGELAELAYSPYEHNYTFIEKSPQVADLEAKIIPQRAIDTCNNFYIRNGIDLGLKVQSSSIIYLTSGEEPEVTTDLNLAHHMIVPFTYEVDGYEVFYQTEDEHPFFCKIDNTYSMRSVVFKDFFSIFEKISQMPPISIKQAVDNIKNGIASITRAESQIFDILDLNWIDQAELYDVKIEYRYDDRLQLAYPFYNFSAKITNSGGVNMQANIVTPAIATELK